MNTLRKSYKFYSCRTYAVERSKPTPLPPYQGDWGAIHRRSTQSSTPDESPIHQDRRDYETGNHSKLLGTGSVL